MLHFELGDFCVTLTTYQNPLLCNPRSGKSPVFLDPAFIHMQRRFEDYYTFFAGLLKLEPQLQCLKAYGTDGEEALVKALRACFPKAVGLRCFLHKQRNLEERLKLASATATTEIMRDIFGVQEGEVFSKGLVDAASEETFDLQLQQLCERWNTLVPGFHEWFVDTQASTFQMYMIAPVREKAQLGSPPPRYITNSNESANCTVKRWVGFTKSSWPAFVDKLQKLVEAQQSELSCAVYGSREYLLAPHMLSFQVNQLSWHHMTAKQRIAHIHKMVMSTQTLSREEGRPHIQVEDRRLRKLSVAAEDTELPTVPQATAQNIWEKAERLLNDPESISCAPGNDCAYMVVSQTSKKPHFVQVCTSGKIVCDEQCPMWRGRKLCSHTVAVAEKAQALPQFLHWLRKSKQECNLTKLVTTSKEKRSAGTKTGKPTRKSGSFRQNTPITTYRSRIDDIYGPSLYIGHEDRDVAPKNTVSVDASNSSHSQVHVSGSMCSSSSNWAHYLPTHTICILISAHTIHRMGIIQTVNRLVHLVPFLLTLQLYHPSPSCTLGLFHPFHHVHKKKQSNGRMLSSS